MSLSLRSARRSSRTAVASESAQRALESLSGAGDVLLSRGRDVKEQVGLLLEQAEQHAGPAAESALAALKPRVDAAGDALTHTVLPEMKDRWSVATTHLVDAARHAGDAMSPLLDDLTERSGSQAVEARRRARSAAAVLRGEPAAATHRKRKAAGLLALGAGLGFLGGLLARRDAASPASGVAVVSPFTPVDVSARSTPPSGASTAGGPDETTGSGSHAP